MATLTSSPSGVVAGLSASKTRKKTGASRLAFDAENGLSGENDLLSPSRRGRRAAAATTPVTSVNASQSLQFDDIAAVEKSTIQVKIVNGDRGQLRQGRGVEKSNNTNQLQVETSSAWMKRAQSLRDRLPLPFTPTAGFRNLLGRIGFSPGTSLRTLIKHPSVSLYFSLAIAVVIAALYLGGLQRRAPKIVMDKVLAHQVDDIRMTIKSSESKMDNIVRHLQAQLDALDGSLKQQDGLLKDKIGEVAESLNTKYDGVVSQVKILESQVAELLGGARSSLTEEDLQLLAKKLSDLQGSEGQGSAPLTFSDVRSISREIVLEELKRPTSTTGSWGPDFALSSAGGKVVAHSSALWFPLGPMEYLFNSVKWRLGQEKLHPHSRFVIDPRASVPGECFPFMGSTGTIDIQLRSLMHPTVIALEHIPKKIAFEVGSAPRHFEVLGWAKGQEDKPMVHLGQYEYSEEGPSFQTFSVKAQVALATIDMVRFNVQGNHGNPNFTCIYRLRVYGSPARVEEEDLKVGTASVHEL